MNTREALTVSQLNEYMKALVDGDEFLGAVAVRGELSNYKIYPVSYTHLDVYKRQVFASLIATGTSLITAATNGYSGAFILLLALSVIALFLNLSLRRER